MNRVPLREPDWLSIAEATAHILGAVEPLPDEDVDLAHAHGRTLAIDVRAPHDHPPWDNSAMDGYAVRSADIRGARADAPHTLILTEAVAAGEFPTRAVGPGEAIRIMTGAPVPAGADSVVRLEHTQEVDGRVTVLSDGDAGRNIRQRGEDMRADDVVLRAGTLLRAGEVGVLAATGRARATVTRRPVVALLSTGDELVDLDRFDEVRAGRRIANSNGWALAAAAQAVGCTARVLGIARDDVTDIHDRMTSALDADAIVTTAGASVGEHDLVKSALDRLGARTLFWRVRIRPGSPFSFALLPRRGQPDLPVFSLPGNPVSAVVTFEILVKPGLRRMLGREAVYPRTLHARMMEPIVSPAGLVRFFRVRLKRDAEGGVWAEPTGDQGSGILTSLSRADALLVVPQDVARIEAGDAITIVPLTTADLAQSEPGW